LNELACNSHGPTSFGKWYVAVFFAHLDNLLTFCST
jgi:hypothetical protein